MEFAIELTPNLAAAQFLPLRQHRRLDRLLSRVARRNRALWTAMQAARQAARAGYSFRWNRQRRLLELTTTHAGWRSIREMADYNRRIDYTTRFFARVEAAIQR